MSCLSHTSGGGFLGGYFLEGEAKSRLTTGLLPTVICMALALQSHPRLRLELDFQLHRSILIPCYVKPIPLKVVKT